MDLRLTNVLIALGLGIIGHGCAGRCAEGVTRGDGISDVQLRLGMPDVISDRSGDQARYYTPGDRPAEEWPWTAPRTYWYLGRDLRVTFERGRATSCGRIDPETRRAVLPPLVERGADPRTEP